MAAIKQEANSALIITIGAISGILLLVAMIGTEAWFKNEEHQELAVKWDESPNLALQELRAEQFKRIETAHVDDVTKVKTIPITEAMKLIVETKGKLPATQPAVAPAGAPAEGAPAK